MRISDWSSDVCSSDLPGLAVDGYGRVLLLDRPIPIAAQAFVDRDTTELDVFLVYSLTLERSSGAGNCGGNVADRAVERPYLRLEIPDPARSEEHTSELQSLMRTSYAVFCLRQKKAQQKYRLTELALK